MNKADKYYKTNLQNILENGTADVNPRPVYKDGTPAHTKFITQIYETYDISKGEFPITTLRNTAVKTGIREMLAIYQKQTNTKKGFHDNKVFWWDEWMNDEGNIGRAYSYNIESHRIDEMKREVVEVVPRIVDSKYSESVGTNITEYGIGYLDNYERVNNFSDKEITILKGIWRKMLKRCYNRDIDNHTKEVFVHQRWHSFKNFLIDIRYLPQYSLARENEFKNWYLDKDYYGSNCYSKDTCVFLIKEESLLYRGNQINPIKITNTDTGKVGYELSYSHLAKILGLSKGHTITCVKKGSFKNLIFNRISHSDAILYRYELSRNQINSLLDGLKNNPFGRRHITSFWNWANIDKKELVECAYETIWSVRKGESRLILDLTLIQRSNDYIMAGYINKTQYVALMMMVAGHLGYEVGKFAHLVQNLHIYDRHIDAANEILDRESLDIQPIITLNTKKDFYNYTLDDFGVVNPVNRRIVSSLEIAV